ncbi:MAG TPA: hypothetical protein PKE12_12865, partial [Kiritimatiellia bacterium]|nr:hypothetical protein [Kiritimatiellia bacterium]
MIAWADQMLQKARRRIRLREPQSCAIITGAPAERIDAEYDAGNRLIRLVIHTRHGSLARPRRRLF